MKKGQLIDPISAILSVVQIFVNIVGWAWTNSPTWLKILMFMGSVAGIFLILNLFWEMEIPPAQLREITNYLGLGVLKGRWSHRALVPADCTVALNVAQKVNLNNETACSFMQDCIASETNQSCKCSCSPSTNNSVSNYFLGIFNLGTSLGLNPFVNATCVQTSTEGTQCNLICPNYCDSQPDLIHNTSIEMTPDLPENIQVSSYEFCADNGGLAQTDPSYSQALQNYTRLDCIHKGFDYLNYKLVIGIELVGILLYVSFILLLPIIIHQT